MGIPTSIVVEAGGSDGGGAGGGGGKGGKKGGKGGKGNGPDGSSGAKNGAPDPAKYPLCGTKSHPVDVVTGRAHTHPIGDFALSWPLPLEFERSASSAAASRDFGLGWAHTFGWLIEIKRDMAPVRTDKGTTVDFPLLAVGAEHLGPFGWELKRETWGYALDADDDVWRLFSVTTEGKRAGSSMSTILEWCAQEAWLFETARRRMNRRSTIFNPETPMAELEWRCPKRLEGSRPREDLMELQSDQLKLARFRVALHVSLTVTFI